MSALALQKSWPTSASSPITAWRQALLAHAVEAKPLLADIYRSNWPTQGELIFTGACSFQCAHCIYPPSFARHNRGLKPNQWHGILCAMADQLGITTFVYGGRSVTSDGVAVLRELRGALPGAHIGMIDNGISMLPHVEQLRAIRTDWFDVSLDGVAADHDLQRGRPGSFADGVRGALWLKEQGLAPRINILTCLTRLNYRSVCTMIREINSLGFKNFFITPVTLAGETGPRPDLRLSREQFAWFLAELRSTVAELQDAWIELLLFSADYVVDFWASDTNRFADWTDGRDEIVWDMTGNSSLKDANALFIRYSPLSLTGIREIIVNTNGDVIVPKAMVYGAVPQSAVIGNLLREQPRELAVATPERQAFVFFEDELRTEASLLRSVF